jgi:hypothetical protein
MDQPLLSSWFGKALPGFGFRAEVDAYYDGNYSAKRTTFPEEFGRE